MLDSFQFLKNKYTKWYYSIINNAQNREINDYTESHHIIPKSLGGNNSIENLERKEKIRQGVLNMPLHTCEHCGKTTTKGNYKRWHNDNCKVILGV